jgi:hypothetical protein
VSCAKNCARSVEHRAIPPSVRPPKSPDAPDAPSTPPPGGKTPSQDAPQPGDAPPRLGVTIDKDPSAAPAPASPQRATLGPEPELQAMGLKAGTPERAAFDKFIKFFDENAADKTDQPWIFYTKVGDESHEKVTKFRQDYENGQHRLPGEPATGGTLHNFSDDFDYDAIPKQLGPGPAPNEDLWYDGVLSFACARLASTRGGPVRILIPKGQDLMPPHKSWTDFEAYELTKPGGQVTELWRYNSNDMGEAPELAWSRARGDKPLGAPADFSQKMRWEPKRM